MKRPAIRWSQYQVQLPTLGEMDEWWGNGHPFGLALICGGVSGGLEMTEIEGRANTPQTFLDVANACDERGIGDVWDTLTGPDGYMEQSPSQGVHFLYRISDHEVPGNTKIAAGTDGLCLAETRGEGGYVIVAPTSGVCHPSGEPWVKAMGDYGQLPAVTWAQRCLLHEAIRAALHQDNPELPESPRAISPPHEAGVVPVHPTHPPVPQGAVRGDVGPVSSPGDQYEAATDWADILEPHGWTLESQRGAERHWTRPGKLRSHGASATTGRAADRDRLFVFSTSTPFDAEVPYTKFGAYAVLNHDGNFAAAARELVRLGYGNRVQVPPLDDLPTVLANENYTLDEVGNGERLLDQIRGRFHYVSQAKAFYAWDGQKWTEDYEGRLTQAMIRVTDTMLRSSDEYTVKWARQSRSLKRLNSSIGVMRSLPGVTRRLEEFDPDRGLLNVRNGILNLHTRELTPHDPARLMTRVFGAAYRPEATCPSFEDFMAEALPDEQMRSYVQRALGYSLLGTVDQRSLFWIYGPPGTGKSTLMDTMREVCGDYGATAPASTFRSRVRGEHGPSNDLHRLRGRRFVTSSETAESASFDEDLLKRLSGRDQVTSRALYQEHVEWTPECAIWMATNNPPRFTSDDNAIWGRTKLIPFLKAFTGRDEVFDMSRTHLIPERDGILNWLLAGLADYLANGLNEPEEVAVTAREQRSQSDPVARFLDEKILEGVLVEGPEQHIRPTELYAMFQEWARMVGERTVLHRRFITRAQVARPNVAYHGTGDGRAPSWTGIGRTPGSSLFGSIGPPIS